MEDLCTLLLNPEQEIDKQYSPMQWSHRYDPEQVLLNYFEVMAKSSALAKNIVPWELNISYSTTEAQKVDIFGAKSLPEDSPIFAFVHGGYWTVGSRNDSGGCAIPLYHAGIVSIIFGYDFVTDRISITDIVKEITQGITFTLNYAAKRKSKGVYFSGHSAGAHLVAMALSSMSLNENQKNLIKGIICISGIYDLEPLRHCAVNEETRVTEQVGCESSPIKFIDIIAKNVKSSVKILVVVAEHDSLAFQKQSELYEQSLNLKGMNSEYCLIMNEDHFSIVEKLFEEDFLLTKKIIGLIHSN